MNLTKSQCPYCGVGCGLKMKPKSSVSDDKWLVSGDRDSPSTQGKLCVKGATVCETCLLYTSPSPRDLLGSRMPSSA